ncbi:MAG TPA: tellurite resistance TerB family protein [Burkholderiaceae bacterium]|nr:tellurite resistance TerB family protein [Burkholderiaceae bacterium]
MSIQNLLEQLLQSGVSRYESAKQSGDLGKYATGAAAGGALALLLGSRGGRRLGGQALKIGTVAALGTLAWRAYNEWQAKQQAGAPAAAAGAPQASVRATLPAPTDFARLSAPQLEDHSRAMLKALIAAARADGHMDERERGVVEAELQRLDADPATRGWVEAELRRPVEPAEVAAASTSPQMAAEIYLASVLVADDTTTMERAYLDELARQLKLAPELKADLEARARTGA